MQITTQEFAQALYLALQETRDEDHDRIINNLIEELRSIGRLHEYEEIVNIFETLIQIDGESKNIEAKFNKVAAANEQIIDELNEKYAGQINIQADDKIIGGAVFRIGDDDVIDGSVRRKLSDMQDQLSE